MWRIKGSRAESFSAHPVIGVFRAETYEALMPGIRYRVANESFLLVTRMPAFRFFSARPETRRRW